MALLAARGAGTTERPLDGVAATTPRRGQLAHLLVAVFLLVNLITMAGMAQPSGTVGEQPGDVGTIDLVLRFPNQVTFTVWGNGSTSNAFLVEARAGDALVADLLVKTIGGKNELTAPAPYVVAMDLFPSGSPNGTTVASFTGNITPESPREITVRLNTTLPSGLPEGDHTIRFTLITGDYDPNPDNNDPRIPETTVLRLGRPALTDDTYVFHPRFLIGPVLFAGFLAAPFVLRGVRDQAWAVTARARVADAQYRGLAWWLHMEGGRRSRFVMVALAGALALLVGITIAIAGGVAFGMGGVLDALVVGLLAGATHLVAGSLARQRAEARRALEEGTQTDRDEPPWHQSFRDTIGPAVRTLAVVAIASLFWQQLAAITDLFRWPVLDTLGKFFVIGISIGAVYALIALGYTMVYGILKFINFAHGEIFMWGAYFAWIFVADIPVLSIVWALPVAMVLTGILGAITERVAYRPLRGGNRLAPLVTAIALSLLLQATSQFLFGAQKVTYTSAGSTHRGSGLESWLDRQVAVGDVVVDHLAILVFVASILLMLALHTFVRYSRMGRAMRAVSDDLETARTIGIDVDRTIMTTFVIGSMLAAAGGVAYGLKFGLRPTMGLFVGIKAFTAAVVGGIGNIYGAFLGGFLIGLAENVGGQFIQPEFQKVITFVILIVFLLVRPQGIFGDDSGVTRR